MFHVERETKKNEKEDSSRNPLSSIQNDFCRLFDVPHEGDHEAQEGLKFHEDETENEGHEDFVASAGVPGNPLNRGR